MPAAVMRTSDQKWISALKRVGNGQQDVIFWIGPDYNKPGNPNYIQKLYPGNLGTIYYSVYNNGEKLTGYRNVKIKDVCTTDTVSTLFNNNVNNLGKLGTNAQNLNEFLIQLNETLGNNVQRKKNVKVVNSTNDILPYLILEIDARKTPVFNFSSGYRGALEVI